MIEKFISYIHPIIIEHGAIGVFLATMLEEIIAPIPSSLIPLAAGFFLLPVDGNFLEMIRTAFFIIALPVAFGITLGSLVVYMIGYYGGKPAIEKSKKWIGLNWKELEKIEKKITRKSGDEIALFVLRMIPLIPGVAISGFCGIVRYPLKKFAVITFLGSTMRAFALGIIGWYAGETYIVYSDTIAEVEKYLLIILAIVAIFFIRRFYILKKRNL